MKMLCLMLSILCLSSAGFAQAVQDISTPTEITWFGVDFSKVKLLGRDKFTNPSEIRDQQFNAINEVIVNEKKKFRIADFFHKDAVNYAIDIVKARNLAVDIEAALSDEAGDAKALQMNDAENVIAQYDMGNKQGLGVVFIMESFDRLDGASATMAVVLFDIGSKKVLQFERMTGKAGGMGFRNYWVATIFKVLREIDDDKWDEWTGQD